MLLKQGNAKRFLFYGTLLVVAFLALSFLRLYTGFAVNDAGRYDINEIPEAFFVKSGESLRLDIDAPEGYSFSDDSEFIDIDPVTGELEFTLEKKGEYSFVIIALKDLENFDYHLVRVVVSDD